LGSRILSIFKAAATFASFFFWLLVLEVESRTRATDPSLIVDGGGVVLWNSCRDRSTQQSHLAPLKGLSTIKF
jgi:hypothetical protein